MTRCCGCPPVGYPTDETRCTPCPQRANPIRHDSGCKSKFPLPQGVRGSAIFRGDNDEHRIILERWWDGDDYPVAGEGWLWIGMNPSGAEADVNDLTIAKECEWTKRGDARHYVKCNIGTYRWTDSRTLGKALIQLIHLDNLAVIRGEAERAARIVISTGKPPDELTGAARTLFRTLKQDDRKMHCLGLTKDGWPKHSSRLAYATPFEEFRG
jgi:hypothetical protein